MDNLTHTLVGATLAHAGLKNRTALGTATLVIGANFPDIDAIAMPLGVGLEMRRGITHGVLALVVLPFVLAGLIWLWDSNVRRRRRPELPPADYRQLVILSAIAILTHPTLDFMNTYGMRWLMPFVDKWFYADGLFIVDLWVLLILATGYIWSRARNTMLPARVALVTFAVYIVANLALTGIGRSAVRKATGAERFMVDPIWGVTQSGLPFAVPWRRGVLVEQADRYSLGVYSLSDGLTLSGSYIVKGDRDSAAVLARRIPEAQVFLHWARFPFYRVVHDGEGTVVRIADARYAGDDGTGWAAIAVRIP